MVNVNGSTNKFNPKIFDDFCERYELKFPKAFIDYLSQYNVGVLESNMIHGTDNEYYIRYFYGTANESYFNIATVYENYIGRMPEKCIPIADPDFGNEICISLAENNYGKIYFWDHETMDTEYGAKCTLNFDDMILIADSFENLLEIIEHVEIPITTGKLKKIKMFFRKFR